MTGEMTPEEEHSETIRQLRVFSSAGRKLEEERERLRVSLEYEQTMEELRSLGIIPKPTPEPIKEPGTTAGKIVGTFVGLFLASVIVVIVVITASMTPATTPEPRPFPKESARPLDYNKNMPDSYDPDIQAPVEGPYFQKE